jgi:RNA polymerase sigma-70 factor, ECF subfamily
VKPAVSDSRGGSGTGSGGDADTNDDTATERAIRAAWEVGDFSTAATAALEAYGHEILTFLGTRLRSSSDAEEAFGIFAEDLWKGLPRFGFRCSTRGWLYTVARNAANRYASSPARRPHRNVELDRESQVAALVDRVRSTTEDFRRTEVKDQIRALRDHLTTEDQTLLLLHVDRALPWREIAMIMHEDDTTLDDEGLTREAARLRKRFERVKVELKQIAIERGLIRPRSDD